MPEKGGLIPSPTLTCDLGPVTWPLRASVYLSVSWIHQLELSCVWASVLFGSTTTRLMDLGFSFPPVEFWLRCILICKMETWSPQTIFGAQGKPRISLCIDTFQGVQSPLTPPAQVVSEGFGAPWPMGSGKPGL